MATFYATLELTRPVRNVRLHAVGPAGTPSAPHWGPHHHGPYLEQSAALSREENFSDLVPLLEVIAMRLEQREFAHRQWSHATRQAVADLALAIAEKIVRQTIDKDQFPIENMVRELWDELDQEISEVRLHPQDLLRLREVAGDWMQEQSEKKRVRFIPDSKLQRGECRVEAKDQRYVAGVETELSAIREFLPQVL